MSSEFGVRLSLLFLTDSHFLTHSRLPRSLAHLRALAPRLTSFARPPNSAKKINSHRWFFNAFGPILQPNVCVLLDVGTQPGTTSIYKLWKTFDLNSNVGGEFVRL